MSVHAIDRNLRGYLGADVPLPAIAGLAAILPPMPDGWIGHVGGAAHPAFLLVVVRLQVDRQGRSRG